MKMQTKYYSFVTFLKISQKYPLKTMKKVHWVEGEIFSETPLQNTLKSTLSRRTFSLVCIGGQPHLDN
jgi:hypothetical protein